MYIIANTYVYIMHYTLLQLVDQQVAHDYHSTLCTRPNTCMTLGGPEGALYSASSSGWMESANFVNWFKMFLKQVEYLLKDGPVVLFVDGHHSHIMLEPINLQKRLQS